MTKPAWFSLGPSRPASWSPPFSNPRSMGDVQRAAAKITIARDLVYPLPPGCKPFEASRPEDGEYWEL